MDDDRIEAIGALLVKAEEAHASFEATEMNGVYDTEWPRWYADYAVEHGLGALVARDVTADRLAQALAGGYSEFERAETDEPWSTYLARRIAEEL
jgi:hypothetical protein